MLDFLRKRKRSWIITLLLGIIIVVFVAFYGGSNFQNSGQFDVASVNGETISQREFALRYQREVERYRELFKGAFDPEMLKNMHLDTMIIDELINRRLALQEARRLGITVTDEELARAIAKTPEFQSGGKFDKQRYLQILSANRLTATTFEDEQRDQLILQRLYGILLETSRVSDAALKEKYQYEREKINLQFIRLPLSDFTEKVTVTDDEVKNYYQQHQSTLKEPLKVQVEYLSFPFDKFSAAVKLNDKEIQQYYEQNRQSKFRKPREAKLQYISIRVPTGADADQTAAARKRAEKIVADARSGKSFDELIKSSSGDPAMANGGDAGWVAQGQLPDHLEKTVFNLTKDQISDVIDAVGSFQVVKVTDVRESKVDSLEEATPEILRLLTAEKAKHAAAAAADQAREKLLGGALLSKLSSDSGATIHETRLFSNGEVLPEIGSNQEFYKNAFSLDEKGVSPVVEGTAAYYLLKLKQKKPAAVPPLPHIRGKIEQNLVESKAQSLMAQKADVLLDQLKKEKSIVQVAAKNNLKLEETGFFTRTGTQLPKIGELPEIRSGGIAVSAQRPVADKAYKAKDATYLLAFKASEPADMAQFASEKETFERQALSEVQQRVLQSFIEGLKAKADIKILSAGVVES